jgi:hypothetical protein
MISRLSVLIGLALMATASNSPAATIQAASLSQSDVQAAANAAANGDTVMLPAGDSPDWSGPVTVSGKNIAIIGAGMGLGTSTGTRINLFANGFVITATNSDATARVSNLRIHMKARYTKGTALRFNGTSVVHLDSDGAACGGFRLDHVRFTIETKEMSSNYIIATSGYLTGVIDHDFVDYPDDAGGSENTDISQPTSVTGDTTPEGTPAKRGQWAFSKPYVYGGGLAANEELDAIYLEDNIINRGGAFLDSLMGGGRIVARYNSSRGHFGGHGLGSGGNMGKRASEFYHNLMTPSPGTVFSVFTARGGGHVVFNNRIQQWLKPHLAVMHERPGGNGSMVGCADGTNFFDLNDRGTLNVNGHTFAPLRVPSDTRIGAVYAQGTGGVFVSNPLVFKIKGLDGGPTANKWQGFVITNLTRKVCPESVGGQSTTCGKGACSTIIESSAGPDCTIRVAPPSTSNAFSITADDPWEIRHIKQYFGITGSSMMDSQLNGGLFGSKPPIAFVTGTPAQRWPNFVADGIWQWGNKSQATVGGAWAPFAPTCPKDFEFWSALTPGGIHNEEVKPGYPLVTDIARRRVGADWDPRSIQPNDSAAPNEAYGGPYPHPLVTGAPPHPLGAKPAK